MAIELDPEFYLAYLNRGVARYRMAQYYDAVVNFDKAIESMRKIA